MDLGLLDELRTEPSTADADWRFEFGLPEERVALESDGRIIITGD
jgi:hypothetical protein